MIDYASRNLALSLALQSKLWPRRNAMLTFGKRNMKVPHRKMSAEVRMDFLVRPCREGPIRCGRRYPRTLFWGGRELLDHCFCHHFQNIFLCFRFTLLMSLPMHSALDLTALPSRCSGLQLQDANVLSPTMGRWCSTPEQQFRRERHHMRKVAVSFGYIVVIRTLDGVIC